MKRESESGFSLLTFDGYLELQLFSSIRLVLELDEKCLELHWAAPALSDPRLGRRAAGTVNRRCFTEGSTRADVALAYF